MHIPRWTLYGVPHYYMCLYSGIWCPRYHHHYLGVNKASSLCFHSITIHQQTKNHLVGHYKVHREPVQRVFWMIQVEEQHKQHHQLTTVLGVSLRRTFWHASTSISTRFDESKKPTTTIENLIIVMMMPQEASTWPRSGMTWGCQCHSCSSSNASI